jgi:hypothetical protein
VCCLPDQHQGNILEDQQKPKEGAAGTQQAKSKLFSLSFCLLSVSSSFASSLGEFVSISPNYIRKAVIIKAIKMHLKRNF